MRRPPRMKREPGGRAESGGDESGLTGVPAYGQWSQRQEDRAFDVAISLLLVHFWTMKTMSISEAKRRLGAVADEALRGEKIIIIRKSRLLTLQEFEPIESIPMRPPGYFKNLYTKAEAKKSNRLAAESPQRIVR